jgi:hypothetical protein
LSSWPEQLSGEIQIPESLTRRARLPKRRLISTESEKLDMSSSGVMGDVESAYGNARELTQILSRSHQALGPFLLQSLMPKEVENKFRKGNAIQKRKISVGRLSI